MHYAERAPSASLAPYVKCIWRFDSESPGNADRIVPDGRPELIVHFRAPYAEMTASGREMIQPAVLFAGQVTTPLRVRATGPSGVIGVRFHPHGARAFIDMPMRECTDRRLALDAGLAHLVVDAADADARIAEVERFVAMRIAAAGAESDALVARMVEAIERAGGTLEVEDLLREAAIGRRQLERRFADAVGIGPALLAAIIRFRRVFDVIDHGGARPWTEAAIDAGYYDQSHFIREFRRFVGCTPTEFEAERSGLASALVEA